MRSGPNQYWSTVEMLGADRLEIVRGPNGIIQGADAIGGVVNIISEEPQFTDSKVSHNGQFISRLSSAEHSWTAGFKGNFSTPDWFAELSHIERSFGDLEGGRDIGMQKNTGYDSRGSQFRLSRKLNEDTRFTIGLQNVFMDDVPRTHKTINGLTWGGLTPGSEIWRRLDQERNLSYGKFSWENAGGFADAGLLTLSLHKHEQERNRMKGSVSGLATGGDFQYFGLEDLGFSSRFETDDPWGGRLAYGAEWQRESVHSGGYKFNRSQIKSAELVQGPLAADAHYDRFAFYLSNNFLFGDWSVEPGIRYSSIQADLDRYYLKNSDSSTLQPSEKKKL
jgi:hemoglobin/transferrin/lactoferrin receptor protein